MKLLIPRDSHGFAFSQELHDFGYSFQRGIEEYHELLHVGGGKERMKHYLHTKGFGASVDSEDEDDLIRRMHAHKTEAFINLIESGSLPLPPGVK